MGDSGTFKQKLLGLRRNLLKITYQLASVREVSKNLTRGAPLTVLEDDAEYVGNISFDSWVFIKVRNFFIKNCRRRRLRDAAVYDVIENPYRLSLLQKSRSAAPGGCFAVADVSAAINSFPEELRIPFVMYIEGYGYSEIAAQTGLPSGSVKKRVLSARERLMAALASSGRPQ